MSSESNRKVITRLKAIEQDVSVHASAPAGRFVELLSRYSGHRVIIAMRGYPDPDSIASSFAVAHIAKTHGLETTVLYFDDISHYENRALVKLLDLHMTRYDKSFDINSYTGTILVDSQSLGIPALEKSCPVIAIIDHHKLQGEHDAPFVDIREDVDSTCSIVAEYLASQTAPFDKNDPVHRTIATAMLFGIRSDTDEFFSAGQTDFTATAFLVNYVDSKLLTLIARQSISPATMEITQRAFANRIISDTVLLSGVGYVRDDDRDSIGQAADYLLRREGIDTVIVYGIVGDIFVDGSLRTRSHVIDPDKFIKDIFGFDLYGTPFGGGRRDKGAFKIPLGPFAACTTRELLWRFVKHTVEDLFYQKLGVHRED